MLDERVVQHVEAPGTAQIRTHLTAKRSLWGTVPRFLNRRDRVRIADRFGAVAVRLREVFLHYALEFADRKTPGYLSFEGFWNFLCDTGHIVNITMEKAADIFCIVVFWQSSEFVQRRMRRMVTSRLMSREDIHAYYEQDRDKKLTLPKETVAAFNARSKGTTRASFINMGEMVRQTLQSRGWLRVKSAMVSIKHIVKHTKKDLIDPYKQKMINEELHLSEKVDESPADDVEGKKMVGCTMGGETGNTPVFSKGMNPEHFAQALLAMSNLLYPVGDFTSRITTMIQQLSKDELERKSAMASMNRVHAATAWDSFDSYMSNYVDDIPELEHGDYSSDGKAVIHRVRAYAVRSRGESEGSAEDDELVPLDLAEDVKKALNQKGQNVPLKQIFDYYTLAPEKREEVLKCTKKDSQYQLLWNPESPWGTERQARRMSLTAWCKFISDCQMDHKLTLTLGACIASALERPSTTVESVLSFLDGRSTFEPDEMHITVEGFIEAIQGLTIRHAIEKVDGAKEKLTIKEMQKGVLDVLHLMFNKCPINRFLKLKHSMTTRVVKKRSPLF